MLIMHSIVSFATFAVFLLVAFSDVASVDAFSAARTGPSLGTSYADASISKNVPVARPIHVWQRTSQQQQQRGASDLTPLRMADDDEAEDPNEIVGKRIVVGGDVNGGYLRTCVSNEAGKFRRLLGTMSPPSDEDEAEIYVEGKRKMVDGFIRWCQRGDKSVGLSQRLIVKEVTEEVPTGLYDGFYVRTGRDE